MEVCGKEESTLRTKGGIVRLGIWFGITIAAVEPVRTRRWAEAWRQAPESLVDSQASCIYKALLLGYCR
jgi:hypothetical protein